MSAENSLTFRENYRSNVDFARKRVLFHCGEPSHGHRVCFIIMIIIYIYNNYIIIIVFHYNNYAHGHRVCFIILINYNNDRDNYFFLVNFIIMIKCNRKWIKNIPKGTI